MVEETRGPYAELTRHFFLGLFDTGLATEPGQLQKLIVGLFGALCSFSMLAPISQFRKYVELPRLVSEPDFQKIAESDRLGFLVFPMFVVAFAVILEWRALTPSGRDRLILLPLPVSGALLFASKFTALLLFIGIFAIAAGLFPALILPVVQETHWSTAPVWRAIAAHAIATAAGVLFTFCTLLAAQALLMNLLGRFYTRVSLALHAALLLAMLCLLPQMLSIPAMHRRGMLPDWFPPLWFSGIEESILGLPGGHLAALGWMATALAAAAAAILYTATYLAGRYADLDPSRLRLPSPARWFPASQRYAIVSFTFKTLMRSPQHKLLLFAYLGMGVAILVNTYVLVYWFDMANRPADVIQENIIGFALSSPLVLAFFVLSGLRVVLSIPAALEAAWLFRLLEADPLRVEWLRAVETLFQIAALPPMLLTAVPFAVSALGWSVVPGHLAACTLLTLILIELALWEWRKLPFVCSYVPGQRNTSVVFVAFFFFFLLFAYTTTEIESMCLREPWRMLIFLGVLCCALAALRLRRLQNTPNAALLFEDRLIEDFEPLRLGDAH